MHAWNLVKRAVCWPAGLGAIALGLIVAGQMPAGTFGRVIPIAAQASDLALDETRGLLYVANLSGRRIEVVSLATGKLGTAYTVPGQPASIDISADGRYLIAGHYGDFGAPQSPENGVTIITLATGKQQYFSLSAPVLGVGFGSDGLAFVVTNTEFRLFDPVAGTNQVLSTISNVAAQVLPVPVSNAPPDITEASVGVSRDRNVIYVLGGHQATQTFKYDVINKQVLPGGVVLASGVLGPRVVSVNHDGSRTFVGWVMVDEYHNFSNFYREVTNQFSVGTTAFDDLRNIIYAQMPKVIGESPTLMITDADNLALIERMQLAENTSGKSIISSDGNTMYTVSASGVTIFPIGSLNKQQRIAATPADLVFRGNFCNLQAGTQILTIANPGGGATDFSLKADMPGITFSQSSGVTPANVAVTVDPRMFAASKGTVTAHITISSAGAVNVIPQVRVLINSHEPDQRGAIVNIPGTLTDIAADPVRDRFYILRQDTNQVLVFNGSSLTQYAALKTYNSPTSIAITKDNKYLLVGHDSSQVAAVYDLDTLQQLPYISVEAGNGDVAHHIATASNGVFAAATDYTNKGRIIQLDLVNRIATQPASLGPYMNEIDPQTVATSAPDGSTIFFPSSTGDVLLYTAISGQITVSRKDFTTLGGGYGASSDGTYWVGNNLLDSSLVPIGTYDATAGGTAGVGFIGNTGYRVTSTSATDPGGLHRLAGPGNYLQTPDAARLIEAPQGGLPGAAFSRTVAPLSNGQSIVVLSESGFMAIPTNYPSLTAIPQITSVVNAADMTPNLASGSLISIFGSQLAAASIAATSLPVPDVLADSCLLVSGQPAPLFYVSPGQINAQLPYSATGSVPLALRTPGGASQTTTVNVVDSAPAIFEASLGAAGTTPTIYRAKNSELVTLSNPIHRGDEIVIFLTGLGATSPAAIEGQAAPTNPLEQALTTPTVTLGGQPLLVGYVGLTPGTAGVYQINATVPFPTPLGIAVPLAISSGPNGVVGTAKVRVID